MADKGKNRERQQYQNLNILRIKRGFWMKLKAFFTLVAQALSWLTH